MEPFKLDPSPSGREECGGVSRRFPNNLDGRSRRGMLELIGLLVLAGVVLALFITLVKLSFHPF